MWEIHYSVALGGRWEGGCMGPLLVRRVYGPRLEMSTVRVVAVFTLLIYFISFLSFVCLISLYPFGFFFCRLHLQTLFLSNFPHVSSFSRLQYVCGVLLIFCVLSVFFLGIYFFLSCLLLLSKKFIATYQLTINSFYGSQHDTDIKCPPSWPSRMKWTIKSGRKRIWETIWNEKILYWEQ